MFNGTEIGSVARLICEDGLSPSGPVIRMCVSSGNWSGQSQSCGVLPMPTPLLWLISLAVIPAGFIMICCSHCCVRYRKKKDGTALPDSDVEHAAGLQVNHPDITLSDTIQNNVPNPAGSKSGVSNITLSFQKIPRLPDKTGFVLNQNAAYYDFHDQMYSPIDVRSPGRVTSAYSYKTRLDCSASYPQFVPGASEGELFGEVHTQYVQSVSSDNTEPK